MTNKLSFSPDFEQLDDVTSIHQLELINTDTQTSHIIENKPGKQASVKIYYALAKLNKNILSTQEAIHGLKLYGDYVAEEEQTPNAHPNIRLLIDIIKQDQSWQIKVVNT